ncbi:MAG: M48 family metalloprotease [Archangium sp.]|nr:M48 family metalloprotease [Archangium sp.]
MKALQLATLSLITVFGSGCALFAKAGIQAPSVAGVDPQKLAKLGADAKAYAEGLCDPIIKEEVGFNEERAIGGVVGVELISGSGHLFLDGLAEKDPVKLNQALEKKQAVTLPDNAINDLTAYVSIVGKNLARYSARPDLPWTFAVIQNDTVNAFSAPGGYVVVTTALLKKITNEAQLAGVLGHEIGHVVHKHSLTKYRDAKHKQCIAANYASHLIEHGGPNTPATADVAKFAKKFEGKIDLDKSEGGFIKFIMQVVITLLQSGNDKESEFQTDKTGLELVVFAGYDASEYEKFLTSLGNQGGGIGASHPSTEERVAKLKALREGELKDFATGSAKPDTAKAFAPLAASK